MSRPSSDVGSIALRAARPEDGAALHALVARIGTLELNSAYCYVLCADHFRDTSVVAELDGQLVGLVIGYRPPTRPEALFVWQVGVAPEARRLGLAGTLLEAFAASRGAAGARVLEATVTPDNTASRRLFTAFARARGAELTELPGYDGSQLPASHAPERLLRIGLLPSSPLP